MISKEAIKRGYNRGNYVVGAHTPPGYAAGLKETGTQPGLQRDPVAVAPEHIQALRAAADEVLTATADAVSYTHLTLPTNREV